MVKNKFNPTFYLRNMLKDLELVTNTAQDIGSLYLLQLLLNKYTEQQIISDFPTMTTAILAFLQRINGMENKK